MKIKLPPSSQNWISLIGVTIALISLFMIIFLFVAPNILRGNTLFQHYRTYYYIL